MERYLSLQTIHFQPCLQVLRLFSWSEGVCVCSGTDMVRDGKVRCSASRPEITSFLFFALCVLIQSTYVLGSFCAAVLFLGSSLLQS